MILNGVPLLPVDTNIHSRFRIVAIFLVPSIFPMPSIFIVTAITAAAAMTREQTTRSAEQSDDAD